MRLTKLQAMTQALAQKDTATDVEYQDLDPQQIRFYSNWASTALTSIEAAAAWEQQQRQLPAEEKKSRPNDLSSRALAAWLTICALALAYNQVYWVFFSPEHFSWWQTALLWIGFLGYVWLAWDAGKAFRRAGKNQ